MNANEISPKASARMNRIQKVSKGIRLTMQYALPVIILMPMLVLVLLPTYGIKAPAEYLNRYLHSLAAMAPAGKTQAYSPGGFLPIVMLVVLLYWFRTFFKLLGLFEKGILFAAETVRCIKILGGLAILSWLVELIFQIAFQSSETRQLTAGLGNLFQGCVIFFLAWIMDEGRKIQEEQELTV